MSEVTSPLQLRLITGAITTNREVDMLNPLRLVITGGFVLNSLGTGSALSELNLRELARLDRAVLAKGFNSFEFQLRFQRALEAIESAVNALNEQVNSNTAIVAALQAASTQAQAANDNATSVDVRTSIEGSYPDPTKVLTASGDGTITIAAHVRAYTSGESVNIDAGSISGLTNEVKYTVFYSDAAREGGSVTYQASIMAVAQGGNVHVLGQVTIPASGSANNSGSSPTAPGVPPPDDIDPPQGYEVFQ